MGKRKTEKKPRSHTIKKAYRLGLHLLFSVCILVVAIWVALLSNPITLKYNIAMKKLFSSAFAVLTVLAFTSCKKSVQIVDPSLHIPQINARIYPNVNQPTDATLGESSASFAVGDKIIVYVPYQIANDEISEATLIIKEENGELNITKPLEISADPIAEGLNVPADLQGLQFMYGTVEVDQSFANKNFVLSVEIRGTNAGYSTDKIENAFTILP